jgi:hypothetical protein
VHLEDTLLSLNSEYYLDLCYLTMQRLTHKTTILSVLLYGCETSPLKLKEERRLRVNENKVLRRRDLFGPQ